jgi:hypothetical protein
MTVEKSNYRGTSLVWPIVLIGMGVVFLLDNLNVIDVDLWLLITRLWPLVLVAVGIDILFGRRTGIWQGLTILIIASIFAAGAWFVRNTGDFVDGNFIAGKLYTQEFAQPLEDAEQAKIDIGFGIGGLQIDPLEDAGDMLATGTLVLVEGEELDQDFRMVGETAYFQLESHGPETYPSWIFNTDDNNREWQIYLSDEIPLDIEISTGIGESVVDLRGLMVTDLDVDTGIGEVKIYLPEDGDFSANISGGIGQLTVYVPRELAIRLHLDTGLGNNRVPSELNLQNGTYMTSGYNTAENRVELYVDAGIGEVEVKIID